MSNIYIHQKALDNKMQLDMKQVLIDIEHQAKNKMNFSQRETRPTRLYANRYRIYIFLKFLLIFAILGIRNKSTLENWFQNEPSDLSSKNITIKRQINDHMSNQLTPACIDHEGNIRDWYIAYKLPKLITNKPLLQANATSGYEYLIITDNLEKNLMELKLCVYRRNSCATIREILAYSDPDNLDGQESDQFWDGSDEGTLTYKGGNLIFKQFLWGIDESYDGEYSKLLQRRKLKFLRKKVISLLEKIISNPNDWDVPRHFINDDESAIVRTLKIAYQDYKLTNQTNHVNSLFYNDELPIGSGHLEEQEPLQGSRYAHAKGVVIMSDLSDDAIWLSHSLPKFPSYRKEGLYFHKNTHSFGQTFMCMSFNLAQSGNQIIDHLIEMKPQIFDHIVSDKMIKRFPKLTKLLGQKSSPEAPQANHKLIQNIETTNKTKLTLFSKDSKYGKDMYADLIEHELKTNLFVQTWRRGRGGNLPSSCRPKDFHTNNIEGLSLRHTTDIINVDWSYLDDHSKWATNSDLDADPWFCISDINRMRSQFSRGGGSICFECLKCKFVFSKMIDHIEACPKNQTATSSL